jgi:hypothetical protein
MRASERLLHEVIIRALQMVLGVWKKYLDDRIKEDDEREALELAHRQHAALTPPQSLSKPPL